MAIQTENISAVAPAATTTFTSTLDSAVTFMSLCNHSALTVAVDIYVVPAVPGIPGTGNLLISALDILADDTYIIYQGGEKLLLENGDSIRVVASTPNAVTAITSYTAI